MKVLVIEDEKRLAATIARGLAADGSNVEVVHDGQDGLWAATESASDVVRGMRARQVWTPVLVLTAEDGEHDEADAFDLGADDHPTKLSSFGRLEHVMRHRGDVVIKAQMAGSSGRCTT